MRDGSATRELIRAAALTLFVEKGVGETTVRDLARSAGIAEGTLYRHYPSMDALVWELFSTNYATFARRIAAVQGGCRGFSARLRAVVGEFCRFFDAEPVLFRFLMLVQHKALPRVANDADNPVELVHRLVDEAMNKGEIARRPAGLAASMVLGLLLQPAFGLVYGRLAPPFGQYADEISAACERALEMRESRHG